MEKSCNGAQRTESTETWVGILEPLKSYAAGHKEGVMNWLEGAAVVMGVIAFLLFCADPSAADEAEWLRMKLGTIVAGAGLIGVAAGMVKLRGMVRRCEDIKQREAKRCMRYVSGYLVDLSIC